MKLEFNRDWSTFTRRIFIDVGSESLLKLWLTAESLERWFFESAENFTAVGEKKSKSSPVETGDTYSWKWYGWEHHQKGEFILVSENEIGFTFGKGGKVKIEFVPDSSDMTQVNLTQYDIEINNEDDLRNYYYGCSLGWSFWLLNLKSFAENGITLNDKNNLLPDDLKIELVNA